MTCGLGLWILVVFLVQAEHACCLWTKGAQSFQNNNPHVGFPPPDSSLITSGRYPQDQVRQGFISPSSVQSRSSNTGGSGPGLSIRSLTPAVSQSAQSSVRLVKSSSASKANWQRPLSPRADDSKGARQLLFVVSSAGGPLSQNQKKPSISRINWSALWGMQRPNKNLILTPRSTFFRPAPHQPSRAAAIRFSEVGSSARLSGPVAPGLPVLTETYASGPAKRVSSKLRSEGQVRRYSPRAPAWKPSEGQGGSRPTSWLQTYKTSQHLAVPRSSTVGAPGQGVTWATVKIPGNYGGFAIRRLK